MSELITKIKTLPEKPGCYIFKNKSGNIIYIGKSKCLKKRVGQYFQRPEKKEGKIRNLIREIYSFDFIVTETETEALLLECRLIKQYKPQYNAMMKRNRVYPFISIKYKKDYPGIYITNESDDVDTLSFGCFYNVNDAENIIDLINSVWKTPLCKKKFFEVNNNQKACFYYHIGKCAAPCCGNISVENYQSTMKEIIGFLNGKDIKKIGVLKKEMLALSKELEFEKAAILRNQIESLHKLQKRTKKFNTKLLSKDFCVFLRAYHETSFSIYYIQNGITLYQVRLDISNCLDSKVVKEICSNVITGKQNVVDGEILSMCITAIGADKLYVDITDIVKQRNLDKLTKCLMSNYIEFYDK